MGKSEDFKGTHPLNPIIITVIFFPQVYIMRILTLIQQTRFQSVKWKMDFSI